MLTDFYALPSLRGIADYFSLYPVMWANSFN
jgi:hypothetical protein